MPDAPYLKDLFQEGILKHTSMTVYLPVVGIAGGLVFCRVRRRHPFARIMKVCLICAFVPVLNSMFYASIPAIMRAGIICRFWCSAPPRL